ncbi:ubiquinone/menaquinone biosynthesis C-methylase UbiE [Natronocella acetinitrilica]|uniref:Ubiquinone/menaquinone biosynthesis C-methylase UbiE n=1 Tax=Natronocella acetinitrilica TaxID=414046 RepID=A0AAE3G1B0_9GAMM|nr:class I SAM-dependent methyltransferase [Natronocella acetinitrilica]MCP1673704.1 ubiquinone/menaquinone biosynthesis C-methylase UbiE [Natronocella acetinitrilica]
MMLRTPEPELMDDDRQAQAYAAADFDEPNEQFLSLWLLHFGEPHGRLLDVGCGPGDIMLRFARRWPALQIVGLDGAEAMLQHGRAALAQAPALAGRVSFIRDSVPGAALPDSAFDGLISNSLLHHLHEPTGFWDMLRRVGRPAAPVLVMDLFRPESPEDAAAIVDRYAVGEPEVLRTDFYNSLLAAFTPEEVSGQLAAAGLGDFTVERVSDRHMLVHGRLPG